MTGLGHRQVDFLQEIDLPLVEVRVAGQRVGPPVMLELQSAVPGGWQLVELQLVGADLQPVIAHLVEHRQIQLVEERLEGKRHQPADDPLRRTAVIVEKRVQQYLSEPVHSLGRRPGLRSLRGRLRLVPNNGRGLGDAAALAQQLLDPPQCGDVLVTVQAVPGTLGARGLDQAIAALPRNKRVLGDSGDL